MDFGSPWSRKLHKNSIHSQHNNVQLHWLSFWTNKKFREQVPVLISNYIGSINPRRDLHQTLIKANLKVQFFITKSLQIYIHEKPLETWRKSVFVLRNILMAGWDSTVTFYLKLLNLYSLYPRRTTDKINNSKFLFATYELLTTATTVNLTTNQNS